MQILINGESGSGKSSGLHNMIKSGKYSWLYLNSDNKDLPFNIPFQFESGKQFIEFRLNSSSADYIDLSGRDPNAHLMYTAENFTFNGNASMIDAFCAAIDCHTGLWDDPEQNKFYPRVDFIVVDTLNTLCNKEFYNLVSAMEAQCTVEKEKAYIPNKCVKLLTSKLTRLITKTGNLQHTSSFYLNHLESSTESTKSVLSDNVEKSLKSASLESLFSNIVLAKKLLAKDLNALNMLYEANMEEALKEPEYVEEMGLEGVTKEDLIAKRDKVLKPVTEFQKKRNRYRYVLSTNAYTETVPTNIQLLGNPMCELSELLIDNDLSIIINRFKELNLINI